IFPSFFQASTVPQVLHYFPTRRSSDLRLLEKYGPSPWPLSSLGYKQAAQFLRGELTRPQALGVAQQAHRNYAKRQMTWFRREPRSEEHTSELQSRENLVCRLHL